MTLNQGQSFSTHSVKSVSQSVVQSVSQSVSQSVVQSVSQSVRDIRSYCTVWSGHFLVPANTPDFPILTLSPTALLIGYSAVNLLISWSASLILCGMCFMEPGNQTQRQARPVTCTALSLSLKIDEIVHRRKRNPTHTLPHTVFAFDDIVVLLYLLHFELNMLITMNIIIQSNFNFPSLYFLINAWCRVTSHCNEHTGVLRAGYFTYPRTSRLFHSPLLAGVPLLSLSSLYLPTNGLATGRTILILNKW